MLRCAFIVLLALASTTSFAQLDPSVLPVGELGVRRISTPERSKSLETLLKENSNGLPNIVLIGYWPPTNEMVREFSPYVEHNPEGWVGKNWEGRGYNIYSFFPEFPDTLGIGEGDFTVDYQGTSRDFWEIVPKVTPIALLSFGRASANAAWEIENITRNLQSWIGDFAAPFYPEPSPPDHTLSPNASRFSLFPGDEIVSALKQEMPALISFVDAKGAGNYLCEYLGYHLSWYRELNAKQVRFAAHTHIGSKTSVEDLKKALKISLRVLIENLDDQTPLSLQR